MIANNPNPVSIDDYVFDMIPEDATLEVPANSLERYRAATGWKNFYDVWVTNAMNMVDDGKTCYSLMGDFSNKCIRYTRDMSRVAGKWQCFFVPFDVDYTQELADKGFEFAKLYMVSQTSSRGDGIIEESDPVVMTVMKLPVGTQLKHNTPYFVRATDETNLRIEAVNTRAYSTVNEAYFNTVDCRTTTHEYTLHGNYDEFNINGYYTMNMQGGFSYYSIDANLPPYRWYMTVTDRETGKSVAGVKVMIHTDGEGDTDGVISTAADRDDAVYGIDGRKVNGKANRGVYISNGKKYLVL